MASVRQWSIRLVPESNPSVPNCTRVHESPGVLFSLGGFSLNFFHAFTDVIVPLFATARPFNRDAELLATDYQPWVASVHKIVTQALSSDHPVLKLLSRYNVVNIDDEQKSGRETHCFSSLTLGLKGRGQTELSINSSESNYRMRDFQQFLKTAYNLKKTTAIKLQRPAASAAAARQKPRLLIISRMHSRTFTNVGQIAKLCRDELGYEVTVAEPYEDTSRYARVVNSCDVMVGVHGAGLTNMVFLPEKAVVIQVVPVGLDRDSAALFGEPAGGLGVSYLEYKIGKEESSLIDKFPADDDVFEKPWVVEKRGVKVFRSIYFDGQNVTLDLARFRPTLLKALELLRQ
ncbi:unnamed protein product [Linum tenue]|uniref:Glycosyltransferase 61 catalytic domain-containing protein n=1 Tax=Linum tenue TaxID=586396 RepID=A0AAV0GRW9_9ROSI|nr:unnamed protein product [Linum tenue]